MDIRSFLAWFLERPRVVTIRAVLNVYGRAAGGLLAGGLAFSALFAAIPTTLLVLGVVGWAASGDPAIQEEISTALATAFPPLAELIRSSVDAVAEGAALTSLVGVIGLLWTVSQLFGAMDTAFARIFSGVAERDALRRTALGFTAVALLGVTVVAIVAALGVFAVLEPLTGVAGPFSGGAVRFLASPPVLALGTCLVVAIGYRKLPPRSPTWRAVVLPAAIVGVILVTLSQAFSFLAPRLVGSASIAGPLASGFAALAWLSLSFQAFLLGAAWVRVRWRGSDYFRDPVSAVGSAVLERAAPAAEPGSGGE